MAETPALTDRTLVISGASRGIGLAIALGIIFPAIAMGILKLRVVLRNTRFPCVSPFQAFTIEKSASKAYSRR